MLWLLVLFVACSPGVDRERWGYMSGEEKTLYVNSLIGAERAASAKGGAPAPAAASPEQLVAQIDTAYASGDERSPEEIFNSLRQRPPQPAPRPASP